LVNLKNKNSSSECKILEIIPHDLVENHYEVIAFMCLRMLSNVATKNVATGGDE
jgi:hypothetical protein